MLRELKKKKRYENGFNRKLSLNSIFDFPPTHTVHNNDY